MIAVTLVAGAAVFGFVNGQAANSEGQYGQAVAKNVNYLNEHYEIVNNYYFNGACPSGVGSGCFSVSLYNNGNMGLNITEIVITNSSDLSAKGVTVGWFKVIAYIPSSPPHTAIVEAYNKNPITGITTCPTPPSTSTTLTNQIIAKNSVPPTIYTVTVPTCSANPVVDGASYTIQVFGSYGNVVQTQVEASW